jgi:L-asparaginase II
MRINADEIEPAVDGCGLPTYAIALDAVAEGCARFAAAAADTTTAASSVVAAMVDHPEWVAGTDRLDTDLMRVAGKRLFAKVGAEGVYCAGVPLMQLGIALKVEDGARRAAEAALLAVLHRVDALSADDLDRLDRYAQPRILNTRQEVVGRVRTSLEL